MQRILKLLVPVALIATATLAQGAPGELALQAGSRLWLTGTSTMHDYSSQASNLKVAFQCEPTRWPATLNGGEAVAAFIQVKGVTAIEVVIPVTGLKSGKEGLDKNMYKTLLAEKHPEIRFRLASYEIGTANDSAGTAINARGTLTVAGVEREILMSATAHREGENVRLRCDVPLLMTQFGIKPPKMMLGAIKTSDKVVVHIDLVVGMSNAAAAASASE
jgi:polyisoprenoid-binding protein YceI